MRDNTMRNRIQTEGGLAASATARGAGRRLAHPLTAFVIFLSLTVPSSALNTQEAKQLQTQLAAPNVQVTQVKALPSLNDKATTLVEIRWTVQLPRSTVIDEFDVLLEVRYSDGSKGTARSRQLKASARATILSLRTHSRQNSSAILQDFSASVRARFRVASSFAVVRQAAAPSSSFRMLRNSPAASRPQVVLTAARLVTQGCSGGQQCVEVRWTATAPRNIAISEFTARVEARSKDGTQTTVSKTVSGQDRQALLQTGSAELGIDLIKVSLLTSFSIIDTKTAVKQGGLLTSAGAFTSPAGWTREDHEPKHVVRRKQ